MHLENFSNKKIFILMIASSLWIKVIGQVYILEIVLLFLLLLHFLENRVKVNNGTSNLRIIYGTLWLAIFSQILTDLFRQSSIVNSFKGFALILFTLINLYVLSVIIGNSLTKAHFAFAGYATGNLLSAFLQPTVYVEAYPWKFGYGPPITLLFMILASANRTRISFSKVIMISSVLVVVDVIYGARSLGAWTFLAVLVFLGSHKSKDRKQQREFSNLVGLKTALIITFCGGIFYFGYAQLASSGSLGIDAMQKFNSQKSSQLGPIVAGRSELVSESIAIGKSPVIGYGSYALLPEDIRVASAQVLIANGIRSEINSPIYGREYTIPVHSGIFQFWLWFGLISTFFFWSVIARYTRSLYVPNLTLLSAFIAISGLWDVFFTPYAANSRIQVPLHLIYLGALGVKK
jgi:hypothetical protein